MEIIKTFYNYKCLECGNKIFIFDLIHNDFYCKSCGLIHNLQMLSDAKQDFYKDILNEIKKNEPDLYELIKMEIKNDKLNKLTNGVVIP